MKKKLSIFCAWVLCLLLLAACSPGKPLPEGMQADMVETKAKEVLTIMNNREYEKLSEMLQGTAVPAERWRTSLGPVLDKLGEFQEFGKVQVMGEEKDGVQYAVALVECKYSEGKAIFSVNFTAGYELSGLWLVG